MVAIVIRLDGTDITDTVEFSKTAFQCAADGNIGMALVRIRDLGQYVPADFRGGETLELFIDGVRKWDGWVMGVTRGWFFPADDTSDLSQAKRAWTLRGEDRNLLLRKRVLYRVDDPADARGLRTFEEGTPDKAAIDYYLQHYVDLTGDGLDIESGIEQVASPGPYEDFTLGFVGAPMGTLFDDCAKITGAVFWIAPEDRRIRYVDDRTVTAPFALSDVPGDPVGSRGYREVDAALDATEMANDALVWGAGVLSAEPAFARYEKASSISTHGRWQWADLYAGASKQSTVERRARTYVEGSPSHRRGHGDDVPVVTCVTHEHGLSVGDVVAFYMHTFSYQEDLPIRSMRISFPTSEGVRYELELTVRVDTPFGVPDLWGLDWPPTVDPPQPPDPPDDDLVETLQIIDHFDREWYWTSSGAYTGQQSSWDIPLPTVPDGLRPLSGGPTVIGDRIFLWLMCIPRFGSAEVDYVIDGFTLQDSLSDEDRSIYLYSRDVDGTEGYTGAGDIVHVAAEDLFSPGTPALIYLSYATMVVRGVNTFVSDIINSDPDAHLEFPSFNMSVSTSSAYMKMAVGVGMRGSPAMLFGRVETVAGAPTSDWTIVGDLTTSASAPAFQVAVRDLSQSDLSAFSYRHADMAPYASDTARGASSSILFHLRRQDAFLGLTPGPDETGAPYEGGNVYTQDSASTSPLPDWMVADSLHTVTKPSGFLVWQFWRLIDSTVRIVDPQGEVVVARPASGFSGTSMLRFRFRFRGTGYLYIEHWSHTLDQAASSSDMNESYIGIYRDTDALELAPAAYDGGEDFDDHYVWDEDVSFAVDAWYLGEVDFGSDGFLKLRVWAEGDARPDWAHSVPYPTYKTTDPSFVGAQTGPTSENRLVWGKTVYSGSIDVDYIGEVVQTTVSSYSTITEVPFYSSVDFGTGLYTTSYPYKAGTLRISYEGRYLRPGIDFFEVDPNAGTFRVVDDRDLSLLLVTYERAADVPTGAGSYYRPRPVLQYGWGTRLDGHNCGFAASCMALDRHYLGSVPPPVNTPPMHRSLQNDQVGGASLAAIASAWSNGWGQSFPWTTDTWDAFIDRLAQGRGCIVLGDYGDLPDAYRFSSTFTGNHFIYVNEVLPSGNLYGCDPLMRRPVVYDVATFQAYAAGVAGSGRVHFGYTRVAV